MSRRTGNIAPEYFERLYAADRDPWRFAVSDYERQKYAATVAALPRPRFDRGLEVGCSIGVLTAQLAGRCGDLLAVDVAEAALAQARERTPGVRFERRQVPADWPAGVFDLIVFSEVLYYFDRPTIEHTAALAVAAMQPGGCILLVHYLGETDYPVTGDDAAESFIAASRLVPSLQLRDEGYRLDRLISPT